MGKQSRHQAALEFGNRERGYSDSQLANSVTVINNALAPASPISKTANYTLKKTDDLVLCDASGGAFNITLYTITVNDYGNTHTIAKTDSSANAVTIVGTVNGVANLILEAQDDAPQLQATASGWRII